MQASLRNTDDTAGFQFLGQFAVPVTYRMPGNVIESVLVEFAVYQNENVFHVQPLCNTWQRVLTNLPANLHFSIQNDNIVMERICFKELAAEIVARIRQPKGSLHSQANK